MVRRLIASAVPETGEEGRVSKAVPKATADLQWQLMGANRRRQPADIGKTRGFKRFSDPEPPTRGSSGAPDR